MRAIWCLVVVSLAIVYGKNLDSIVIVPPLRVPKILQVSAKCIEDLKLEQDTMQKYFAWELSDSDSTRKYMFCLGNESGYVTDDGILIKNEVLELVGNHRDRVDGIIDECNKIKYNDKYEMFYQIVMCFHEKSKLQFKI